MTTACSHIRESLTWCNGKSVFTGVRGRIYYVAKADIVQWPSLPTNDGKIIGTLYSGSFTLASGCVWRFIDVNADTAQLTSEPQGDYPSQTQLNKLIVTHKGFGEEASAAALYINNQECVFIIQNIYGNLRVLGSKHLPVKGTVAQDQGQNPKTPGSTTITIEATDFCPAPFYDGSITTENGAVTGKKTQDWVNVFSTSFEDEPSFSSWCTVDNGVVALDARGSEHYLHFYCGGKARTTEATVDFTNAIFPARLYMQNYNLFRYSFDYGASSAGNKSCKLKVIGMIDGTEQVLFNVYTTGTKTSNENTYIYKGSTQTDQIGDTLLMDYRMSGFISMFCTFYIEQKMFNGHYMVKLSVKNSDQTYALNNYTIYMGDSPCHLLRMEGTCQSSTNFAASDIGFDNLSLAVWESVGG